MKLLFLIISSHDSLRNKLIDFVDYNNLLFSKNKNEHTIEYYHLYNTTEHNDYYIDESTNSLYLNGVENYKPGIFNKTIKALRYFKNSNYSFIIRTNLSTIYLFKNLLIFLESIQNTNCVYGTSRGLFKHTEVSMGCNFKFPIGYNIIIPSQVISKIILNYDLNKSFIDEKSESIADDCLLGYILHKTDIKLQDIRYNIYTYDFNKSYIENKKLIKSNTILIRNRLYDNILKNRINKEIVVWETYLKDEYTNSS